MAIGIYEIRNIVNRKSYIGQSKNISNRLSTHKGWLRSDIYNSNENIHLWRSWQKYGEEVFTFGILTECNAEELTRFEEYYIQLIPKDMRYNIREAADSNKGIQLSQETKDKISNTLNGYIQEKEHIQKRVEQIIRPVQQLDLETGKIIAEFESLSIAAKAIGCLPGNISNVCNKKYGHKSTGGFGWQFY